MRQVTSRRRAPPRRRDRSHEVRGNAKEPRTRHIRAEPRPSGQNRRADREFDDPHDSHERAGRHGQQLRRQGADVRAPVREQIEEFVESGERSCQANAVRSAIQGVLSRLSIEIASCPFEPEEGKVTTRRMSPFGRCGLFILE